MSEEAEKVLAGHGIVYLAQLMLAPAHQVRNWLRRVMSERQLGEVLALLRCLPSLQMGVTARETKIVAGTDAEVEVSLKATNESTRRYVYAPHCPKPRPQCGWWLAMGEGDELHALKRVHLDRGSTSTSLSFLAPEEPGTYHFEIYLISDSYIGLDQRHKISIHVVA